MFRIIAAATFFGISAADCGEDEFGILFVEAETCLTSVVCGVDPTGTENAAVTPTGTGNTECPFDVSACSGARLTSFVKVDSNEDVECVSHMNCDENEVQANLSGQEECVPVPSVAFTPDSSDATIAFIVHHSIDLKMMHKFVLFDQSLDNAVRSIAAQALGVPNHVNQISATAVVGTEEFSVDIRFPAGLVAADTLSRGEFGTEFERIIPRYQPFLSPANIDVYVIRDISSNQFWDALVDENDDVGQSAGTVDVDYDPSNQQDDGTAIIIVVVVASVVFVCGAGVVIHHFRKKHKVVYAETIMEDGVAVPIDEVAPVDNGGGLRIFKAKQDWSGDESDPALSYPLKFQMGDIIAAFEMDGVMYGYLRGAQPVDGSVEQVIRDGQFPKATVDEVPNVQNYNNEFLWWAETSDDGKQYLHWVYIKGISMERSRGVPDPDITATTSTPRSEVFSTVELTGSPEELLASTLVSKLEELSRERQEEEDSSE